MTMRKFFRYFPICIAAAATLLGACGCNKFLDVVPNDGLATIETAFNLRSSAIDYLATCYSYMTHEGAPGPHYMEDSSANRVVCGDSAMLTGDELWDLVGRAVTNQYGRVAQANFSIARGLQSATTVYANDWPDMYKGIRCCDILCDNIASVPDMTETEKAQWIAEAKFLKAYYHFRLLQMFGPIPVIDQQYASNVDKGDMIVTLSSDEDVDIFYNFFLLNFFHLEDPLVFIFYLKVCTSSNF